MFDVCYIGMWWLIGGIFASSALYFYNNPSTLYNVCEKGLDQYLIIKNKISNSFSNKRSTTTVMPIHENKLVIKDIKVMVPFSNFIKNVNVADFDEICGCSWSDISKKYVYDNTLYKSFFSMYLNHIILHIVYSYDDIEYRIAINHTTPLKVLKDIVNTNNLAFTFINEPEAVYTNIPRYQLNYECINTANEDLKRLMIMYAGPKNDYYSHVSIKQDYKGFLNFQMTEPIFTVSLSNNGQSFHMNEHFIKIIDIFGNEYDFNSSITHQ